MDKELHNRIKEATDKFCEKNGLIAGACASQISYGYSCMRDGFIAGAEYGYKEAIKMAKEWFDEKLYDGRYWGRDDEGSFLDGDELLTDFENDTNKFWEEQ